MYLKLSIIFFTCFLFSIACNNDGNRSQGKSNKVKEVSIEIYDTAFKEVIDTNATAEIIGSGFNWAEGPLWIADKKMLLFSDVLENKIFRWKQGDSTQLYLTPSGYTDTAQRNGENGSNGLALDKNGKLLLCQSGNRQVVRMSSVVDSPKAIFTVLAASYKGKKFNSPNDLVCDSKNNIYFTDPVYGLPEKEKDPTRELSFEGVYKIAADGKLSLLIDSIPKPNGIALSNDEKILYVASSDEKIPRWYAYQLDSNKNILSGGVLLDALPLRNKASVNQSPDGFKLDKYGNIFSAGPDGINIISPTGKLVALVKVANRRTSNCAFNEMKDVLYVTADDIILRIVLHP